MEKKIIKDMRGTGYEGNYLQIENNKLYYAGMPVKYIWQCPFEECGSNYQYSIMVLSGNVKGGIIALREEQVKEAMKYIQDGYKSDPHSLNPNPESEDDGW